MNKEIKDADGGKWMVHTEDKQAVCIVLNTFRSKTCRPQVEPMLVIK